MRVIFLTLILTFGTPALAQKRGAALEKCMLEGANVILNIWNREEHISNEVQIMLAGVGAYSACEKRGHVRRDQLSDKEIKSVLNKVYINLKNYWLLSREA